MSKLTKCDICGEVSEGEPGCMRFNPEIGAMGGAMHWIDGDEREQIEWPLRETSIDLCFECTQAVAETLRGRIE